MYTFVFLFALTGYDFQLLPYRTVQRSREHEMTEFSDRKTQIIIKAFAKNITSKKLTG